MPVWFWVGLAVSIDACFWAVMLRRYIRLYTGHLEDGLIALQNDPKHAVLVESYRQRLADPLEFG